jgi:hypothetical protein
MKVPRPRWAFSGSGSTTQEGQRSRGGKQKLLSYSVYFRSTESTTEMLQHTRRSMLRSSGQFQAGVTVVSKSVRAAWPWCDMMTTTASSANASAQQKQVACQDSSAVLAASQTTSEIFASCRCQAQSEECLSANPLNLYGELFLVAGKNAAVPMLVLHPHIEAVQLTPAKGGK